MTQKIALITGASRGLGAAMAEALARSHHVVAVARTAGALEALDDRIQAAGGAATLAPMDISNAEAMQTLCRGIYDRWGRLDLWVHTAVHATALTPAPDIATKDFAKAFEINVTATATLIGYLTPLLGTEGKALFFDDPVGGQPYFGSYGASKAAQIALARSWAAETTRTGPQVHIVQPAPMPTATRARFHPGQDKATLASPTSEAERLLAELG